MHIKDVKNAGQLHEYLAETVKKDAQLDVAMNCPLRALKPSWWQRLWEVVAASGLGSWLHLRSRIWVQVAGRQSVCVRLEEDDHYQEFWKVYNLYRQTRGRDPEFETSDLAGAIDTAMDGKTIDGQGVQVVQQSLVQWMRRGNQAAVQRFLNDLKAEGIDEQVIQCLEKDFEEDGELIGKDIQEGEVAFSQALQDLVRDRAKQTSEKLAGDKKLAAFRDQLKRDLLEGRAILTPAKPPKFKEFYELSALETRSEAQQRRWQQEFCKIINQAYLNEQIRKKQGSQAQVGSFVETTLLEALGFGSPDDFRLRKAKHQAEVDVMRLIMDDKGLDQASLEDLAKQVEEEKLVARLGAAGVPERDVAPYAATVRQLEGGFCQFMDASSPWKQTIKGLSDQIGQKITQYLLSTKAIRVESRNHRIFRDLLKKVAQKIKRDPEGIPLQDSCRKLLEEKSAQAREGKIYEGIDKALVKQSKFHEKWQRCLVQEMIQGLDNDDEVFHKGTCLGTTTRWVCHEQRHPHQEAKDLASNLMVGRVAARDRFRQLYHNIGMQLLQIETFSPEKIWPEGFRKTLHIKEVKPLFSAQCPADKVAQKVRENVERLATALEASHGVMSISIHSHVLYLRMDPKSQRYRLGDTNVGLFEFGNADELFNCLQDLMGSLYNEKDQQVAGFQFKLD